MAAAGQETERLCDALRIGRRRRFTPLQRAQVVVLACSVPRQYGKPWQRWSGEKLVRVAIEQQLVNKIAPSTIRAWLRQDKIKPWRYHSWQHSTDPQFVPKAVPVLDLYEQAPRLQARGELTLCVDEKISIQARHRGTLPPRPRHRGKSCRWPIATNGWEPCNSFVL